MSRVNNTAFFPQSSAKVVLGSVQVSSRNYHQINLKKSRDLITHSFRSSQQIMNEDLGSIMSREK